MTGPAYPKVSSDSNAIGNFIIGVSPIGDIPSFDVWKTIIAEYANSPVLTRLIENMDSYLDPTLNFQDFYDKVFNVVTAQGHGLDVWGRIVGVSRILSVTTSDEYLGFEEALPGSEPFNQAPFFSGQQISNNFILSDSAYRTLIFVKALANICDGSIPAINQILINLFPNRGNCYVVDNLNMTMSYKFEFVLSAVELAILAQSGALPKSTGVSATVITIEG